MLKLYKRVGDKLHYHEAWGDGSIITEHWGVVGDRGKTREHPVAKGMDAEIAIAKVLNQATQDGFEPLLEEDHAVLIIEFCVEGFGTRQELERRQALQDRMDEVLGWTALGHCDGGSAGSGTMEVYCLVVD